MHFHGKTGDLICRFLGILLLVVGWKCLSVKFSGLVIASPEDTLVAAFRLIVDNDFLVNHFWVSLKRIGCALGAGIVAGTVLGVLSGLIPGLKHLLEPLRWMLMTIPGVVIVVVFMLWFGMGSLMVVGIAVSMIAPVIFVNVSNAMACVDKTLIEMADVYRFSMKTKLMKIYAMTIAGPFFSGIVIAAGNGIRVVVLAELLGANEGIGHYLSIARTNLDTPELYALALISMFIVGGIEFFMLRPLKIKFAGRG